MNAMHKAPERCPMDIENLNPKADFLTWWMRGAELVGVDAFPMLAWPQNVRTWRDLPPADRPTVMKRLNSLDTPRRVLLLTMACLAEPQWADWLQREQGLHFGDLVHHQLGTEVFQVLVGILANHWGEAEKC